MTDDGITVEETVVIITADTEAEATIEEMVVTAVVEAGAVGIQGPASIVPGPKGDQGDPGADGQNFSYDYNQVVPAATWVIVHNLGGYPNATVADSAGSVVEGDITYDNPNQLTIQFAGAFSGSAHLS